MLLEVTPKSLKCYKKHDVNIGTSLLKKGTLGADIVCFFKE